MKRAIYFLFGCLMGLSCVEPYDFKSIGTERTLVIDASLTNELKAHSVLLSYSYAIDTTLSDPITGATVWFEDQDDNRTVLAEAVSGRYETDPGFSAMTGNQYRLHVEIGNEVYESDWESVPEPVPMDSLYGSYVTIPSSEDETFMKGVQFFVDSHDPTGQTTRFRYEWVETYQIVVPYRSWFIYDEADSSIFLREDRIDICYRGDAGKSLILSTTDGLSENRISELPIRFADEDWIALRTKYSLLVRQYSLNSNAYNYYKRLKENNESSGSFFDKQKGTINGNIHAVGNLDQTVLGYFEVSGVTELRDYFSIRDFVEQGFKVASYPGCFVLYDADTVNIGDLPEYYAGPGGGNFIITELDPPGSGNYLVMAPPCADCRVYGVLDKPEWWED